MTSSSIKKHVFFDVDGVLLFDYHSNPNYRIEWDWDLSKHFQLDILAFNKSFFGEEGEIYKVITGKRELKDALQEHLSSAGFVGHVEDFIQHWHRSASNINSKMLDFAKYLSQKNNYQVYIATNQEVLRADWLWYELGFKNIFSDIFYSGKIGHKKPDRAFFMSIQKSLHLDQDNDQMILIDDSRPNIDAAEAVGWGAIHAWEPQHVFDHMYFKD